MDVQHSHILLLLEDTMKNIKVPWLELIQIFQDQTKKIVEDVQAARADDKRVDKEELKDIVAENIIELIVPITKAFIEKNGI